MAKHHPTPALGVIVPSPFERMLEALHAATVRGDDARAGELRRSIDSDLCARERVLGIGTDRAEARHRLGDRAQDEDRPDELRDPLPRARPRLRPRVRDARLLADVEPPPRRAGPRRPARSGPHRHVAITRADRGRTPRRARPTGRRVPRRLDRGPAARPAAVRDDRRPRMAARAPAALLRRPPRQPARQRGDGRGRGRLPARAAPRRSARSDEHQRDAVHPRAGARRRARARPRRAQRREGPTSAAPGRHAVAAVPRAGAATPRCSTPPPSSTARTSDGDRTAAHCSPRSATPACASASWSRSRGGTSISPAARSACAPLKTSAGVRTVDLQPELLDELTAWRATTRHARPSDRVFPRATGRPLDRHAIRKRVVVRAAERANDRIADAGGGAAAPGRPQPARPAPHVRVMARGRGRGSRVRDGAARPHRPIDDTRAVRPRAALQGAAPARPPPRGRRGLVTRRAARQRAARGHDGVGRPRGGSGEASATRPARGRVHAQTCALARRERPA